MTLSLTEIELGKISEIYSGYAFKSSDLVKERGIPIIKIANIQDRIVLKDCIDFLPKSIFTKKLERYILHFDDILIAMTGAGSVGRVGKMRRVNDLYLVNQRVAIVRIHSNLANPEYIYQVLSNGEYEKILYQLGLGAGQPNVSPSDIGGLKIPLPPLPTQRKIAAILSAYDDLIENNTRRIRILEEMAQAIYREWFVHFRFPGHEGVRMVESELGMIPEGWEVKPFSQIASFINGYAFKPSDWSKNGIPIIKIVELKNGITNNTPYYSGKLLPEIYTVKNSDILFSWSADLNVYIWSSGEALLNQHLFNVHPNKGISKNFIYFSLKERMNEFKTKNIGTTMRHIRRSALSEVKCVVPDRDILKNFSDYVDPLIQFFINLNIKNANLRRTRDLLLPRLISGELDVSELDIVIPEEDV